MDGASAPGGEPHGAGWSDRGTSEAAARRSGDHRAPQTTMPRTRKRPKELVRHRPFDGSRSLSKPQSLVAAGSLARWPCDLRTWFPGPTRGSLLGPVWRFTSAPSGKTKCTARAMTATRRLSTNCRREMPEVIPELPTVVDELWIHSVRRCRMARLARTAHGRPGSLGTAVRRLQPALAERAVPARSGRSRTSSTAPGSATRSTRRPRTSRSGRCCSSSSSTWRTSGRPPTSRWLRRCCSCSPPRRPAPPTTSTRTAPHASARRSTPR